MLFGIEQNLAYYPQWFLLLTMAVSLFRFFGLAQKLSCSSKNQATPIRRPFADELLSINTLIEDVSLIVVAKYDLEYWNMSQARYFLAFLEYQPSKSRIQVHDFYIESSF